MLDSCVLSCHLYGFSAHVSLQFAVKVLEKGDEAVKSLPGRV